MTTATRGTTESGKNLSDDVLDANFLLVEEGEKSYPSQPDSARSKGRTASTEAAIELSTTDLRDFIAFEFSLVPQVDHVFTALRDNGVFYAWIVTDEFRPEVRQAIYKREQAIIDEFDTFEFDFYIVARQGRRVEDLIGDSSIHLTYRRSPE